MKVIIDKDEWYPVYCITNINYGYGQEAELSDQEIERCEVVFKEFNEIQNFLREKYNERR